MMKKKQPYLVNHKLETSGPYIEALLHRYEDREGWQTYTLRQHWPKLIGEDMAKYSYLRAVEHGLAQVTVLNSVYKNYMFLYRAQLVQRMNEFLGRSVIKDVRFTTGRKQVDKGASGKEANHDARFKGVPLEEIPLSTKVKEKMVEAVKTAPEPLREKLRVLREAREKQQIYLKGKGFTTCPTCGRWLRPKEKNCFFCAMKKRQEEKTKIVRLLEQAPWLVVEEVQAMMACDALLYAEAKREMIYTLLDKIYRQQDTEEEAMRFAFLVTKKKPVEMTDAFIHNLTNKYRRKIGTNGPMKRENLGIIANS